MKILVTPENTMSQGKFDKYELAQLHIHFFV